MTNCLSEGRMTSVDVVEMFLSDSDSDSTVSLTPPTISPLTSPAVSPAGKVKGDMAETKVSFTDCEWKLNYILL